MHRAPPNCTNANGACRDAVAEKVVQVPNGKHPLDTQNRDVAQDDCADVALRSQRRIEGRALPTRAAKEYAKADRQQARLAGDLVESDFIDRLLPRARR